MTKRLIGLVGTAGSGKSLAAQYIVSSHGYEKMAFADPFKKMLLALGVPKINLYGSDADKSVPLDVLCGKSARHAMQTLGTGWGRKYLKETYWTEHLMRRVAAEPFNVVIDDVRHIEEAEAIRKAGGNLVRVMRDGARAAVGFDHSSENEVMMISADYVLPNNGTMGEMFGNIDTILKRIEGGE